MVRKEWEYLDWQVKRRVAVVATMLILVSAHRAVFRIKRLAFTIRWI
jgi:hypothetical protein